MLSGKKKIVLCSSNNVIHFFCKELCQKLFSKQILYSTFIRVWEIFAMFERAYLSRIFLVAFTVYFMQPFTVYHTWTIALVGMTTSGKGAIFFPHKSLLPNENPWENFGWHTVKFNRHFTLLLYVFTFLFPINLYIFWKSLKHCQ